MPGDVLIVEDEAAIADTIAYALETEGFRARRCVLGGRSCAAKPSVSSSWMWGCRT